MKRFAFTLAEVLITLVIIGVVAALTIPTLMHNTQEKELMTAMRKQYAVLSQAMGVLAAENGGTLAGALENCPDEFATAAGGNCFKDVFKTKFKYIKECDAPNSYGDGNCFVPTNIVKYYSGATQSTNYYLDPNVRASIVTADGATLGFISISADCDAEYDKAGDFTTCASATVDVNGAKGPNQFGKDFFVFFMHANKVVPYCGTDCTASGEGYTCSCKFITDAK